MIRTVVNVAPAVSGHPVNLVQSLPEHVLGRIEGFIQFEFQRRSLNVREKSDNAGDQHRIPIADGNYFSLPVLDLLDKRTK